MPINSRNKQSDAELILLIQEDEHEAFEQIYNGYWSKLYMAAYKILRDRQASQDVVQEVLVKLWLRRKENNIASLSSYLHNAVRFQVFNHIRNGKVRAGLYEEIAELSIVNDAEEKLSAIDLNRMLEGSMIQLPDKCRKIFLLSRQEQLSTKEIAQKLALSPKTVENQLTIALRRLRISFGKALLFLALLLIMH